MVGVRVRCVGVSMIVPVMMIMSMPVIMHMRQTLQLERPILLAAQSFNMVMVALLGCTYFGLKT